MPEYAAAIGILRNPIPKDVLKYVVIVHQTESFPSFSSPDVRNLLVKEIFKSDSMYVKGESIFISLFLFN